MRLLTGAQATLANVREAIVGTDCLGTFDPESPSLLGTAIVEANMADVDLYIDGDLVGSVSRDRPLTIPRLSSGLHEFTGVREGYEPDTKQIMNPTRPGGHGHAPHPLPVAGPRGRPGAGGARRAAAIHAAFHDQSLEHAAGGRSQSIEDLERAREFFEEALAEDPAYGKAAYRLGQVHQLLGDYRESEDAYRRALEIDPSDVEVRVQVGAVLLESEDPDAAIRELTDAARLDPTDELHAMVARAYWDKGVWAGAVSWATQAIARDASNAQAHLWKADALRQMAAVTDRSAKPLALYREAGEDFRAFLNLTNLEPSLGERLAFHFIGFGVGRRRHGDRKDAWSSLRTAGYLGLCITEQRIANPLRAREYCRRAVNYGEHDPIAHFLLGNVNRDLFNVYQTCEYLSVAARSYSRMLERNEHLDESNNARNYREQITGIARQLRC